MKIEIRIYKKRFKITQSELEDYYRWYLLPEPEIKSKEDIDKRIDKLRKCVEWVNKIADKYNNGFRYHNYRVYPSAREIETF